MESIILKKSELLYGAVYENGRLYAVPPIGQPKNFTGNSFLWIIDRENNKYSKIETNGEYKVKAKRGETAVSFLSAIKRLDFEGYPHCDFLGNKFCISLNDDGIFEATLAKFYWESILNECAERTVMRRKRRLREGYVLSTLKIDFYGGTYPAVDHEFHIRGRLAFGDSFDAEVVKRMIELQLKMMKTDWRKQYRNVLSLQPNGRREYRIYRKSKNKKTKAIMFLLTGNLEIVEEMYNYYCLTKDIKFIADNIYPVEKGLETADKYIDENGRLWGDVYYEDQVMKDGANAQAQAFAISAFRIMAKLERLLGCNETAQIYSAKADKLKENYIQPLPGGYWDDEKGRYIDWIDRKGEIHDHVHLLSNALSVTLNLNSTECDRAVIDTIHAHDNIFQKFPSFVAAEIEDYTESEIGSSPYDLCAAGRYWCHDAKFRRHIGDKGTLKNQLTAICNQAKLDNYKMGERYDMNYVYFNTGEDAKHNWHGSPLYYEYPNVFADVLIHDYIGILPDEEADFMLYPCLKDFGEVAMESYGIKFEYTKNSFSVTNLKDTEKQIRINLSKLFDKALYISGEKWVNSNVINLKGNKTVIFKELSE